MLHYLLFKDLLQRGREKLSMWNSCQIQVVFDKIYVCCLEFFNYIFFPGHCGLSVALKVSFREADIKGCV